MLFPDAQTRRLIGDQAFVGDARFSVPAIGTRGFATTDQGAFNHPAKEPAGSQHRKLCRLPFLLPGMAIPSATKREPGGALSI
jgi:hypothetical protein